MVLVGAYFGAFQAVMPLIGYFLGSQFQSYIVKMCIRDSGRSEQKPQDFERHFERFYRFQGENLQCFLIQLIFTEEFESQKEIEKKKLTQTIRRLLESVLSVQGAFCVTEHGEGGFLLFAETIDVSCLNSFLHILQNDNRWFIPYVGASSMLTISQMVLAYDEARSGLEYSIFHQNAYHIQSGGHPLITRISYYATEEARLLLNLQKGDLTQVKTSLEELLNVYPVSYTHLFLSVVVVVGMLNTFLSSNGVINEFLGIFGLGPYRFLAEPKYFRTVYIASGIWQSAGWGSIIYLSALSAVEQELYEAAQIDGANRWQQMLLSLIHI